MSLDIWVQAIWWLTNQKTGISASGIQRAGGMTRHETAGRILHNLRLALGRPHQDRLFGAIQVDEVFLGGENKTPRIGVAAQIDGKKTGRIRMEKLPDRSGPVLQGFVAKYSNPGSTVVTEGLKSYCGGRNQG